jgi:hypothetical protein
VILAFYPAGFFFKVSCPVPSLTVAIGLFHKQLSGGYLIFRDHLSQTETISVSTSGDALLTLRCWFSSVNET